MVLYFCSRGDDDDSDMGLVSDEEVIEQENVGTGCFALVGRQIPSLSIFIVVVENVNVYGRNDNFKGLNCEALEYANKNDLEVRTVSLSWVMGLLLQPFINAVKPSSSCCQENLR
ncbi:hypothetical protein AAC387_Pa04g2757 [Persea americana]